MIENIVVLIVLIICISLHFYQDKTAVEKGLLKLLIGLMCYGLLVVVVEVITTFIFRNTVTLYVPDCFLVVTALIGITYLQIHMGKSFAILIIINAFIVLATKYVATPSTLTPIILAGVISVATGWLLSSLIAKNKEAAIKILKRMSVGYLVFELITLKTFGLQWITLIGFDFSLLVGCFLMFLCQRADKEMSTTNLLVLATSILFMYC